MGVVYQINFPDGRYYIGHTVGTLKNRLSGHLCSPASQVMYEIMVDSKYTISNLFDMTSIIYDDWDSSFYEISIIYKHRNDPNILNKRIRKIKPSYNDWFNEDFTKNISINTKGTYLKYREYLESSEMDKDTFMDNLLNLYYKALTKESK